MAISSRNNQPTDEELLGEFTKKLGTQLKDQLLRVSNKIGNYIPDGTKTC